MHLKQHRLVCAGRHPHRREHRLHGRERDVDGQRRAYAVADELVVVFRANLAVPSVALEAALRVMLRR
ncbi:hypothetical protein [Streptomyces naganishii]|uniref:hypothetical protein n=1 Tax=Streptomyces naganishii TaxID=285447 RepID=UPI00167DB4AC|nr:hypothetical protein [Streptomyces naganishii]